MDDAIRDASRRFYVAANAVMGGDAGPMLALWSASEAVTYAAPNGVLLRGPAALRAYWEEAAKLNRTAARSVTAVGEILALHIHDDVAYTVTIEHLTVAEGAQLQHLQARASHIYRLEDGGTWHLLHRHAEQPVSAVDESERPTAAEA